jgi:nucleotide-binding universal stress UspA family protein
MHASAGAKTIVVGFDETERAQRALERAAELAEGLGARLVVTTVAVPPIPLPGVATALPGTAAQFAEGSTEALELAEQHLERARTLLAGRELETEFVLEVGSPAERIVAVAEERSADLVVVGSSEGGFLERLLNEDVGDDVAHASPRDVVIVH